MPVDIKFGKNAKKEIMRDRCRTFIDTKESSIRKGSESGQASEEIYYTAGGPGIPFGDSTARSVGRKQATTLLAFSRHRQLR